MDIQNEALLGDTPFVAVDLDVMDRNIARLAALAKEANVKLRPHTKTHKSAYVAKKQMEMGACGVTVAKLGEAEVMVDHGITDILIAFPLIGKQKLERFYQLLKRADLMVSMDDIEIAKGISAVGEAAKRTIPIYMDIDTGLHRMGRDPQESIEHIIAISRLPHIEIRGLMSHTGHAYAKSTDEEIKQVAIEDAVLMNQTKEALQKRGVHIQEISVGATATARFIKDIPFATEFRPGMYVFNDRSVMAAGGATAEDCAVNIVATVVARPTKDRLIIDAGSKTFARDPFKHGGHGLIRGHENLVIATLSEEHGTVEVTGETTLKIGDVVQVIPNHICPAINLADELYGFRNGELETVIPVSARGKNR